MSTNFQTVSMSLIDEPPSPLRGSVDPDKLAELAQSLSTHGQLQPIRLKDTNGRFTIIAGHRRFLAAQALGWTTIAAIVKPPDSKDDLEESLAENIHRENLTPIEEARLVHHMVNERGLDVDLVAIRFAKTRHWVDGRLELIQYPQDILTALHTQKINLGVARELARVADPGYRDYLLHNAVENGCTAKTARLWVDEWERSAQIQGAPTTAEPGPPPPYEGQAVGIACAGCDTLYPIANLRPLYCCPQCTKDHFAMKAEARAKAGRNQL